jgi:hypothetical protein
MNKLKYPRYKFDPYMPMAISSGYLLSFKDVKEGIEVDIMVNKLSEVCNSMLLL